MGSATTAELCTESLQTKERTLGLSVEEKRELLALMLELKA
jgi:DNA primase